MQDYFSRDKWPLKILLDPINGALFSFLVLLLF